MTIDPRVLAALSDPTVQLLLRVVAALIVALVVHGSRRTLASGLVRAYFIDPARAPNPNRAQTLRGLLASAITVVAIVAALLFILGQFISADTLLLVIGLFSGALGFGVMPIVRSLAAGFSLITENQYTVGDKVEILGLEGVVEDVSLRVTRLRAPTGELIIIPNGDIITIRNFTRGSFTQVTVTIKLNTDQLLEATHLLEDLGREALPSLPNLVEPWIVISPSGQLGATTELSIVARARLGKGAEMRPRLVALLNERLEAAGIQPLD